MRTPLGFSEALDAMKRGERMCRSGWETGIYLRAAPKVRRDNSAFYMSDTLLLCTYAYAMPWTPSQDDLFAGDWQTWERPLS